MPAEPPHRDRRPACWRSATAASAPRSASLTANRCISSAGGGGIFTIRPGARISIASTTWRMSATAIRASSRPPHARCGCSIPIPGISTSGSWITSSVSRRCCPSPCASCIWSAAAARPTSWRCAWRVRTRGRNGVIVVETAYHGNTNALIDISPYKFDGPGGRGRPAHVQVVPMPDRYRGLYHEPESGPRYAAFVAEAARRGEPPAAFFSESALSCGGPGHSAGGLPARGIRGCAGGRRRMRSR